MKTNISLFSTIGKIINLFRKVCSERFVINKENNYRGGKKFVFCFGNPVLRIG